MQKLVIASNNPGKLREFQFLLQPLGIEVLTQAQLGISEAEEPHVTFIENALAKARHVSRLSGLPALADDSGICVTALGGAPGVLSARYAGDNPKSDRRNNEKLLQDMQGVADRRAHYYCVLVLLHHADDPQPLIAEGEWHGEIAHEERGDGVPIDRVPRAQTVRDADDPCREAGVIGSGRSHQAAPTTPAIDAALPTAPKSRSSSSTKPRRPVPMVTTASTRPSLVIASARSPRRKAIASNANFPTVILHRRWSLSAPT